MKIDLLHTTTDVSVEAKTDTVLSDGSVIAESEFTVKADEFPPLIQTSISAAMVRAKMAPDRMTALRMIKRGLVTVGGNKVNEDSKVEEGRRISVPWKEDIVIVGNYNKEN